MSTQSIVKRYRAKHKISKFFGMGKRKGNKKQCL